MLEYNLIFRRIQSRTDVRERKNKKRKENYICTRNQLDIGFMVVPLLRAEF